MVPAAHRRPGTCACQTRPVSDAVLPRNRVARKPWNLARIGARFIGALGEIEAQREPWARYWDEHNATALSENGPLWVALGDSMHQGIGASSPENGFVIPVVERLSAATGDPWRVINLSMTGARISHVVDEELPTMRAVGLEPDIATCVIGFNDFIGGTSAASIRVDARRLVRDLPRGTLVGRVSTARFQKRATELASAFAEGDGSGQIVMFDPWKWPDARDVLAGDRFHLNDKGYRYVADAVFTAMMRELQRGG